MSKETIARLIVVGLALVNTALTLIGWNPIPLSDDAVYATVSAIVAVATTVWAWWKNNSVTKAAITADSVMCAIKENDINPDEIVALVNELKAGN